MNINEREMSQFERFLSKNKRNLILTKEGAKLNQVHI